MTIETKDFDFEVKSVDDSGTFTGYGSVFGNVDQGNEIVAKGAFSKSLRELASKKRKVPILWQHMTGEPLGVFESVKEDEVGLLMEGRLLTHDVQRAREGHALMKAGAVTGLSIGYLVRDDSYDAKTGVRTLKKLDLLETSIVTFPMNDMARVSAVKSMSHMLKAGAMPSLSEFEDFLCEAGFSRSQSKAVAGHGLRKLLDRREADGNADEALQALKAFRLT